VFIFVPAGIVLGVFVPACVHLGVFDPAGVFLAVVLVVFVFGVVSAAVRVRVRVCWPGELAGSGMVLTSALPFPFVLIPCVRRRFRGVGVFDFVVVGAGGLVVVGFSWSSVRRQPTSLNEGRGRSVRHNPALLIVSVCRGGDVRDVALALGWFRGGRSAGAGWGRLGTHRGSLWPLLAIAAAGGGATGGGDAGGGGGKEASDVGIVARLFPDLGWAGTPGSEGGTYLLKFLS
jgi:hypothetical protein